MYRELERIFGPVREAGLAAKISHLRNITTFRPRQRFFLHGTTALCGPGSPCYWEFTIILRHTIIITWCFSDRASWINYILIANLMHWLLFIHKILFSCTCFDPQVLIFRRIQLYTCSIWYCHSLWEFVVACRYTAWVRTVCTDRPPRTLIESDSTICCMYTTVSSWRWELEARNM